MSDIEMLTELARTATLRLFAQAVLVAERRGYKIVTRRASGEPLRADLEPIPDAGVGRVLGILRLHRVIAPTAPVGKASGEDRMQIIRIDSNA